MIRQAKDTLSAAELDLGEPLFFTLSNGHTVRITALEAEARIIKSNLKTPMVEEWDGRTVYEFSCRFDIDGESVLIRREVPTQNSFYEPLETHGVILFLDAVSDIFQLIAEAHGDCAIGKGKRVRIAFQDASAGICPEALIPLCPLPPDGLKIENCYCGDDCWLGPYQGASAHGGLDINHPPMTPIIAPFDIHEQYYFNSVANGDRNNRWRGIHHWSNGANWIIQVHHMTSLCVEEHTFIPKGTRIANGAGVHSGRHHHSHFVFKIQDYGEEILLDPWILFRQFYLDFPPSNANETSC